MSFASLRAVQNDEEFGQGKSSDYDEITCRICRDGETKEPLVSPCNCKGSLGLVHVACLHRWLLEARRSRCEVCGAPYQVERRLRRCAARSLATWCCVPHSRTRPRLLCRRARRALYAEASVAVAAGFVLGCGFWACVVLADHYATRAAYFSGHAYDGDGPSVIQIGAQVIAAILVLLMSGSVMCFSWWTINVLRKQARIWYYWWQHDVMMVVVAEPITVSDYRRRMHISRGPGLASATSLLKTPPPKPKSQQALLPPSQQPPPQSPQSVQPTSSAHPALPTRQTQATQQTQTTQATQTALATGPTQATQQTQVTQPIQQTQQSQDPQHPQSQQSFPPPQPTESQQLSQPILLPPSQPQAQQLSQSPQPPLSPQSPQPSQPSLPSQSSHPTPTLEPPPEQPKPPEPS